jgi:PAS domain S-box-containing protein
VIVEDSVTAANRRLVEEVAHLQHSELQLEAEVAALREAVSVLEEACALHLDAYDYVPIACVTLDKHGAIRNANRRAVALLGFEKRQLLGVPLLTLLAATYRRRFLEHVLACKRNLDPAAFEVVVMSREKESIPVRLSIRGTAESGGSYAVALTDLRPRDAARAVCQQLEEAERLAREANKIKDGFIAVLTRGARKLRRRARPLARLHLRAYSYGRERAASSGDR